MMVGLQTDYSEQLSVTPPRTPEHIVTLTKFAEELNYVYHSQRKTTAACDGPQSAVDVDSRVSVLLFY